MVEVTEADKKLLQDLAINLGNGGSRHNREQLVATHREAAAKAERDRLRELPDDVLKQVGDKLIDDIVLFLTPGEMQCVATALADALEKQP